MADDAVSRIDDSAKKRNRGDFALWKFSQAGDPSWPAPFGDGRPGWHIEDTAITEKYFGPQYDIHGGGEDLKFPHHEAEIAQQESASSKKPFVKYWLHNGFLVNKEQKMSKSIGNFDTVHELLKKYPKEILRFYLLSGNYHSPLDYSEESLKLSEAGIENIKGVLEHLEQIKNEGRLEVTENPMLIKQIDEYFENILLGMENDFNTQEAFGVLGGLISYTYQNLKNFDLEAYEKFMDIIKFFDRTFGFIVMPEVKTIKYPWGQATTSFTVGVSINPEIMKLVDERGQARKEKDFVKADKLTTELKKLGVEIEDNIHGTLIRIK